MFYSLLMLSTGFSLAMRHDFHSTQPAMTDAVVVAEARVVTLLVGHAGKEQDAHGKSQTEGDDLEGNAPLPSKQGLDDVMDLSHVYNVFSRFLPFSMQKSCQTCYTAETQKISVFPFRGECLIFRQWCLIFGHSGIKRESAARLARCTLIATIYLKNVVFRR